MINKLSNYAKYYCGGEYLQLADCSIDSIIDYSPYKVKMMYNLP